MSYQPFGFPIFNGRPAEIAEDAIPAADQLMRAAVEEMSNQPWPV